VLVGSISESDVLLALDGGDFSALVLLNAFDTVDHEILLRRLVTS